MHPFIVAISFCTIVLLFLAAATVSAQPQSPAQSSTPTTPPPNNVNARRGGHHGPHGGHHRLRRGGHHARGGHHLIQNRTAPQTPTPSKNQNDKTRMERVDNVASHNPPSPPANQYQNPNKTNPIEEPAPPSQRNENNMHPGNLFGYISKNDTSYDNKTLLMEEFLHAHNWVRSKYNLPPFKWDVKLESFARSYLMERYNDCKMVHSNSEYGENMFWGQKLHWTPCDAVYYWYDEKNWYDFNTLKCLPNKICGHFTQIVWKDSERLGCALQHCNDRNDGMLIACEYDPPGNFENENPLEQHNQKR